MFLGFAKLFSLHFDTINVPTRMKFDQDLLIIFGGVPLNGGWKSLGKVGDMCAIPR